MSNRWLSIHRKHQDDLEVDPIVCLHWETADRSLRIFCLWHGGAELYGVGSVWWGDTNYGYDVKFYKERWV
jgi:hypothetical protein